MTCTEKSIAWEEAELFHILFFRYPAIFIFQSEYESEYECECKSERKVFVGRGGCCYFTF